MNLNQQALRVSSRKVYDMIHDKEIEAQKVGQQWRVRRGEL